jgi:outer membrane protein insertion porin family
VVRRNLTFYPLDRANTDEMKESERLLRNTGYFDLREPNPVEIRLEPEGEAIRDAVVRVKEGGTGAVMFGLGISSDAGLLGQISYHEENFDISNWPSSFNDIWSGNAFRGGGQKLTLEFMLGTQRSSVLLSFLEPSVADSAYSFGTTLYSRMEEWDEFDLRRTGAAVTLGKKFDRYRRGEIELGFESISMSPLDDAPPEIRADKGTYSKPHAAFRYIIDRRDSPLLPAAGYMATLTAEAATADIQTIKLMAELEKYWTLWKTQAGYRHILSLKGQAGVLDSYGGSAIPVFERFYAGGIGSLRGFALHGVSPVEPVKQEQVGGNSILLGSVEYTLPLWKDDLRFATFMDAGYVGEKAVDIVSGWDVLRLSAGVGLRWRIPGFGNTLLITDFAFPLIKKSYDDTQVFQFSLGLARTF